MGVLSGLRVIEMAGIGPGPFAAMMLADAGAEVIRLDRVGATRYPFDDTIIRGRRSVALDLKDQAAVAVALRLIGSADILLEGFRPGVMERLGLGPETCLERNPALVYGRMTGWGNFGPWADQAGHDIDYLALTGLLHAIGTAADPVPPLNLVGDFGGGGMMLAFGVVSALLSARTTGRGQVVDVAMTDGAALLGVSAFAMLAHGAWVDRRAANRLDGGTPFYGTYRTADGKHMAVGALEPQFYAELLTRLGLDPARVPDRDDEAQWPALRALFTEAFAARTRAEWEEVFAGSDACVAPVLSMTEAAGHPHNVARETFVRRDGRAEVAPAPRFSATPSELPAAGPAVGADTLAILREAGLSEQECRELVERGAAAGPAAQEPDTEAVK